MGSGLASIGTTYVLEALFECTEAKRSKRPIAFLNNFPGGLSFFFPAHITGLTIAILLYSGSRVMPFVFAPSVAICSKTVVRVQIQAKSRHFLNPSNTGIALTLVLFFIMGWNDSVRIYGICSRVLGFGDSPCNCIYWNFIELEINGTLRIDRVLVSHIYRTSTSSKCFIPFHDTIADHAYDGGCIGSV